jgi:hypothetical protein
MLELLQLLKKYPGTTLEVSDNGDRGWQVLIQRIIKEKGKKDVVLRNKIGLNEDRVAEDPAGYVIQRIEKAIVEIGSVK